MAPRLSGEVPLLLTLTERAGTGTRSDTGPKSSRLVSKLRTPWLPDPASATEWIVPAPSTTSSSPVRGPALLGRKPTVSTQGWAGPTDLQLPDTAKSAVVRIALTTASPEPLLRIVSGWDCLPPTTTPPKSSRSWSKARVGAVPVPVRSAVCWMPAGPAMVTDPVRSPGPVGRKVIVSVQAAPGPRAAGAVGQLPAAQKSPVAVMSPSLAIALEPLRTIRSCGSADPTATEPKLTWPAAKAGQVAAGATIKPVAASTVTTRPPAITPMPAVEDRRRSGTPVPLEVRAIRARLAWLAAAPARLPA